MIFPALTAMRLFKSFRGVVVCAAVTSVCCFCAGLMASWTLSTPVGASVVAANLALFLLSCAAGWLRRRCQTAGSAAVPYIRRIFYTILEKNLAEKGLRFSSICAMMRMLEE